MNIQRILILFFAVLFAIRGALCCFDGWYEKKGQRTGKHLSGNQKQSAASAQMPLYMICSLICIIISAM